MKSTGKNIGVVIPAYKVSQQIVGVVKSLGPEVKKIIVVDDACPENSGKFLQKQVKDRRLEVLFHSKNTGVGGAMKTGYRRALELNLDVIVKLDGDGQMDSAKIKDLINPILDGKADYTKGNRFFEVEAIRKMPKVRIFGNLFLSFLTKLSTGYWRIFDPNNGFTAITNVKLAQLPLNKIDNRYFFESDMLFRLYLADAVVSDVTMPAIYGSEKSNLKIGRVLFEFPWKHKVNFWKRIAYSYYLKQFNLASIELPLGLVLGGFGLSRAITAWHISNVTGNPTPAGTVVLAAVLLLASLQFILAFFNFDMNNDPKNK